MTVDSVSFQQPQEVEGTECSKINDALARALWKCRTKAPELWLNFREALPLFLLANLDLIELDDARCLTLSAVAFERLIQPSHSSAQGLAE